MSPDFFHPALSLEELSAWRDLIWHNCVVIRETNLDAEVFMIITVSGVSNLVQPLFFDHASVTQVQIVRVSQKEMNREGTEAES